MQAEAADVHAAAGGELFAGEEEVEIPAEGEEGDGATEDPGEEPEDLAVADHRQTSHHPAHHAEGLGRVGKVLQEENRGGAGEGDGDAGQEEGLGGDALAAQGKADDEGGGGEGAGEAGEGHGREAERGRGALEAQGHHRAEGRAAGDAEGVGLGQGVAEEGLEAETGEGEAAACQQREQDAGQAQLPEDRRRGRLAAQRGGQGHRVAAQQRCDQQRRHPDPAEDGERGAGAAAGGVRRAHGRGGPREWAGQEARSRTVSGRSPPRTSWKRAWKSRSRTSGWRISAGVPSAISRPPDSARRRSPRSAARLRSWVASTTVRAASSWSRSSSDASCCWWRASRCRVGSSSTSSCASWARAAAMNTAWRSPPESSSTGRPRSSRMPTRRRASSTAAKSAVRGASCSGER